MPSPAEGPVVEILVPGQEETVDPDDARFEKRWVAAEKAGAEQATMRASGNKGEGVEA